MPFCTFSFGHCVVCSSSIYGFWLPLWYLQTFLIEVKWTINEIIRHYLISTVCLLLWTNISISLLCYISAQKKCYWVRMSSSWNICRQDALSVNDLLEKQYHNVDVSGHLFNSIVPLVFTNVSVIECMECLRSRSPTYCQYKCYSNHNKHWYRDICFHHHCMPCL